MNKYRRIKISVELLADAFAMPEGTGIHRAELVDYGRSLELLVSHDEFSGLLAGETPPLIMPVITANYDKKPSTWLTFEWGEDELRRT